MFLTNILKFILFTFGGLTGVLTLLVSYVIQLPTPTSPVISEMSPAIQEWFNKGSLINVLGKQMFTVTQGSGEETIILIHGFPTSSFDYFDVIDSLSEKYKVVVFDHIGFGFSEKPVNYTYTLMDQADQALTLWKLLGIRRAHIVSHDMGDSVLTEILSRYQRGVLSEYFDYFFQSITFTNGGMVYDLINKRLSQILLNSAAGSILSEFSCKVDTLQLSTNFNMRQLGSIWSPGYTNEQKKQFDISNIETLNKYNNGKCLFHKTISYLTDRARFEPRWLESLSKLELPIQLLWGDADAVSPMSIPQTLAKLINPDYLSFTIFPDTGHFLTLERPELWLDRVLSFVSKNKNFNFNSEQQRMVQQ